MNNMKKQGSLSILEVKNAAASAKISLQGAHIFEFQSLGQKPLLWLSKTSYFETGKGIRGGIPICWPWFGVHQDDPSLPKHGFARTALWHHESTQANNEYETEVVLTLKSSVDTLKLWPYAFELTLVITVGENLTVSLTTTNCDTQAFTITQALHTYLAVEDISDVFVGGLDKKYYYNKVDHTFQNLQKGVLRFSQETDRVYADVSNAVIVVDKQQSITLKTLWSNSIVVWNPWDALAQKMPDLSDYKTMLCVESAHALDDVCLVEAGESHTLHLTIVQS